jgi:hypothetical protein
MATMSTSGEDVRDEIKAICRDCGAVVVNSTPTVIYTDAADPREVVGLLQDRMTETVFRTRDCRVGDAESTLTVLDPIDMPVTIKVRRTLDAA